MTEAYGISSSNKQPEQNKFPKWLKIFIVILVLGFALSLFMSCSGCTSKEPKDSNPKQPTELYQVQQLQTLNDSLSTVIEKLQLEFSLVNDLIESGEVGKFECDSIKQSNENLRNAIEHQNTIIRNLRK